MFVKDEEQFIKESKFKINHSVVANSDNQPDNSWAVSSHMHDITRPSWLSPPSLGKSYMRISIGQFIQSRTEALGSLGHEQDVERVSNEVFILYNEVITGFLHLPGI